MMKSTTNTIVFVAAIPIIAGFALISIPQMMIVSVNAQSEEASEHACPAPGFKLSKGECTAESTTTTKLTCEPSTVAGVTAEPVPDSELCRATTTSDAIDFGISVFATSCASIEGGEPSAFGGGPGNPVNLECTFPATKTETISCPGGITPTEEGKCITKPGRGNDPRT